MGGPCFAGGGTFEECLIEGERISTRKRCNWNVGRAKFYTPHQGVMQGILDDYELIVPADKSVILSGNIPRLANVTETSTFRRVRLVSLSDEVDLVLREELYVSCYFQKGGANFLVDVYAPKVQNPDELKRFCDGLQEKLNKWGDASFAEMHGR